MYIYIYVATPDWVSANNTPNLGSEHRSVHFFMGMRNEKEHNAYARDFPQVSAVRMSHSQTKHNRSVEACSKSNP